MTVMKAPEQTGPVVVILSVTSDIGLDLAKRYVEDGYEVIGTYRSTALLPALRCLPRCTVLPMDVSDPASVDALARAVGDLGRPWNILISCVGDQRPIGKFFDCDFDEWSASVQVNALGQLRAIHRLHPYRDRSHIAHVVLFAGGGTNNAVPYYTAYTISKIMLIKMCELIDFENEDLNVFIVGPGWTRTKSHRPTLELKDPSRAGANYLKTMKFMESGEGTSLEDIYQCIQWLVRQGRRVAGGRNFSIVHDPWKGDRSQWLVDELLAHYDMFKLRRYKNID